MFTRKPLSLSVATALATSFASSFVLAASPETAVMPAAASTTLDPIVVTATRSPTKTSSLIAQTLVINAEQMAHYQAQSALDVIKAQPGFNSFSYGDTIQGGNFYLRGYDSKSVLVLIDGIRYSSVTTGQAALNLLPANQIERIEILYGASAASLYGADAVGGVIQIFTKKSNLDDANLAITAGVGSHNQQSYGVSTAFSNASSQLALSASYDSSDGINATLPSNSNYYGDDDGFEGKNASLALTHRLGVITVGANALYSKSTKDYDANAYDANFNATPIEDVYGEQENGAANVFVSLDYAQGSTIKAQYGRSIDKLESHEAQVSNLDSTQDQLSVIANHRLSLGSVIVGAEHLKQKVDSSATSYSETKREVSSGFVGYQISHDRLDAAAHVRYDDNSQFGSETTYTLGAGYRLTPELRIGASYATGFRAPTFNELYAPAAWGSNPKLNPETSKNSEAFIEYINRHHNTRLTGYHNDLTDMITYVPDAPGSWTGSNKNINKAKIEGISLTSDWAVNDYLFGLSYDYQQAKDNSGGNMDGKYLIMRPEHKGSVYAGYRWSGVDLRAEYQHIGSYYGNAANTVELGDYGLVNLSGTFKLSDHLRATTRINNLLNEDYTAWSDYATDGTSYFASLTYQY